jgi:hypothetical protein
MQNFNNFSVLKDVLNNINEDLNFSYDIEWENDESTYVGYFLDNEIMIDISNITNDCWFYKFFRLDKETDSYTTELNATELYDYEKKTNILGTIKKSIETFIKTKQPMSICFSTLDESTGRKNIYELFCNEMKQFDYKYVVYKSDNKWLYIIYNNAECINDIKNYFAKKYNIRYGR